MCVYTHVFIFTRVSNREEVLEYWAIVPGDPLPRRIHVRMNVWLCVVVYVHTHTYIYICIHNKCWIIGPSYQWTYKMYTHMHVCLGVYLHSYLYVHMHVTKLRANTQVFDR